MSPLHKPTVIVADDQPMFLDIVSRLLARDFDILAAVLDGEALVREVDGQDPEVLVVDISMPILNGIDAVDRIRSKGHLNRADGARRAVVFLTNHQDEVLVEKAIAAGGLGYVLKSRAALDLLPAIAAARSGARYTSPGNAGRKT
jgi:DNA-binding NarL/FixJ family response regulator